MENTPSSPNNEPDPRELVDETKAEAPRRFDLGRWIERLRDKKESVADDDEEDEEGEEESPKTKRGRSLVDQIFDRVVRVEADKEDDKKDSPPSQAQAALDSLLTSQDEEPQAEEPIPNVNEDQTELPIEGSISEEATEHLATPAASEAEEDIADDSPEIASLAARAEADSEDLPPEPPDSDGPEEPPFEPPRPPEFATTSDSPVPAEFAAARRPVEPEIPSVEQIGTIAERAAVKAGAASFVAGEIFSRSRDRKLRREDRSIKKDLSNVNKRVDKLERTPPIPEKPIKYEMVEIPLAAINPERRAEKRSGDASGPVPEKSFKELDQTSKKSEKKEVETKPAEAQRQQVPEALRQYEAKAERVVGQSAEPNRQEQLKGRETVEALFDRRHEVLDEDAQARQALSQSVQWPVAGAYGSATARSRERALSQSQAQAASDQPVYEEESLYRQAVVGGAWAALAILLGLIVWSVLR